MYYQIEYRWPSWALWKPVSNASYNDRDAAYNRLSSLRKWNKGEFRVIPIVENDPPNRILDPIFN